jgi:hypothetical protein
MMTWATAILAVAMVLPQESKAQPAAVAKQVEGRVQSLTTAPMGEVDGAILDDRTVIHWPPHLAERFAAVTVTGDRIRAAGRMETGPEGDTHLEVQTVTNLRNNASAENEAGPPPPAPGALRRVGPPARRPVGLRPVLDGSADFAPPRATNDEIERRLKALENEVAQLRREIQKLRDEL